VKDYSTSHPNRARKEIAMTTATLHLAGHTERAHALAFARTRFLAGVIVAFAGAGTLLADIARFIA
jgi:hypothetical protein